MDITDLANLANGKAGLSAYTQVPRSNPRGGQISVQGSAPDIHRNKSSTRGVSYHKKDEERLMEGVENV